MRVLFFGTSDFAVPSLLALIGDVRFKVIAVVTQPDRPQGRGKKLSFSPVKVAAMEHVLPLLQPERVRNVEFVEHVRAMSPDVLALASFGQIIPRSLLEMTPLGPINVHGSLLPKYRGAAPIQYAILNGETVTGVTTMWMAPTLDTGDILLTESLEIGEQETAGELTVRMAESGAGLLIKTLELLQNGQCPRTPQNNEDATFSPAITLEDCRIDWSATAYAIDCRIRAMNPRPSAFSMIDGKRLKIWSALPLESEIVEAGVVESASNLGVDIGTAQGLLRLVEVQPEGSKRMRAADWARGARIVVGTKFEVK